jgi:hypothetical protein
MIRTIYRNTKGGITTDLPETHWKVALHDGGGLLWIDLADEPKERVEKILTDAFHFHQRRYNLFAYFKFGGDYPK